MSQTAHHQAEMMRHFEAGRIAEARLNCRIWTRMVAAKKKDFLNDGTGAPGLRNPVHAGTPSPINGLDGRAGNERLRKQTNNGSVAR